MFSFSVVEIFDVFVDQFISGPLEPEYYISFSSALVDCLSDFNCTGIVQDYQYFRRTRGIDEIATYEEAATAYIKRGKYAMLQLIKKCYLQWVRQI